MLTEILNPKELLANPWNPNRLTPEAEMKLENSLARLGMFKPILVRTLEDGRREILGAFTTMGTSRYAAISLRSVEPPAKPRQPWANAESIVFQVREPGAALTVPDARLGQVPVA